MKPLIDADILVYEAGSAADIGWKSESSAPWEYVVSFLEQSLSTINAAVKATEPPLLFLTGESNFRYDVAITKPYKGNRKHEARPFHYDNLRAYIPAFYDTIMCEGYEADDGLAMYQYSNLDRETPTIICSRDKDLRMIPGWHYTWQRAGQPEWGPSYVDELGELYLSERLVKPQNPDKRPYKKYKCRGTGLKFFYAQLIMGDATDNIPGLRGCADVAAYNAVNECKSEIDCYNSVRQSYIHIVGDEKEADKLLMEQAYLLWMVRERNEDGTLKMWEPPV